MYVEGAGSRESMEGANATFLVGLTKFESAARWRRLVISVEDRMRRKLTISENWQRLC